MEGGVCCVSNSCKDMVLFATAGSIYLLLFFLIKSCSKVTTWHSIHFIMARGHIAI